MSNEAPLWLKLRIERDGPSIKVTLSGTLHNDQAPQALSFTMAQLAQLGTDVGWRAQSHQPLPAKTLQEASALYADLFRAVAPLYNLYQGMRPGPILLRLAIADTELQAFPWEVALEPDTQEGFLGTSSQVRVVREVSSKKPFLTREVEGSIRVLILAATGDKEVVTLRQAFASAEANGAVELLEPIVGAGVAAENLRSSLLPLTHRDRSPHIVHIIGHGALAGEPRKPVIELPGDVEPVRISVESLAQDLEELFPQTLRLIVLDSCRSAAPGAAGSAAEILARGATSAVVAYLWKVREDVACAAAKSLYTSLTLWDQASGDVAGSLNGARRDLLRGDSALPGGAGAFLPVLYLRGDSSVLFDFRRPAKPRPPRKPTAPGPGQRAGAEQALQELLQRRSSLLLGDLGEDPLASREALSQKLADRLGVAVPSLSSALQRYALLEGRTALESTFKDVFDDLLEDDDRLSSPLTAALAGVIAPGVHTTLLWLPLLELALARRHPDRDIYAVQPPAPGGRNLWVRVRGAGQKKWSKLDAIPERISFDEAFVVLRPYGGYLPKKAVMSIVLTEDDYIRNARLSEAPSGWNVLLREMQKWPALIAGLSVLEWRHRLILSLLFDRPPPKGSLAIIPEDADMIEQRIWEERGGGLTEDQERVGVVRCGAEALPDLLQRALAAKGTA